MTMINPKPLMDENPIFESLFAPLYFRARETQHENSIIEDTRAAGILELLDYDFSYFDKNTSGQFLVSVRTKILDEQVSKFISESVNPVIINMGSGLDTRYSRMLSDEIKCWYDLDLPEVVEFRRHFFRDTKNHVSIGKSVLDFSWVEDIRKDRANTYLFIAEGLLMYFSEIDVKELFRQISNNFPASQMLCEVFHSQLINYNVQNEDANKDISFKWGVADTTVLASYHPGITIENQWRMFDYHKNRQTLLVRLLCKISPKYRDLIRVLRLKFPELRT